MFALLLSCFVLAQATAQAPTTPLPPAPGNPVVVIETTMGNITVELFKDKAPVSVENFLHYAADGFYVGTIFHRVERGIVIQGGGLTEQLVEKATRPPILNEATNGLLNLRGTVGMARKRALRSATSQFYINVSNNPMFDHRGYTPSEFGYAVFGRVVEGMDVVDRIASVRTVARDGLESVPEKPIVITAVTVKSGA